MMRHITQNETLLLREGIVSSLTQNGTLDEIEAGGLTFVLDGKVRSRYAKASTGVELLGMKETYNVTAITVENLRISGTYDASGDEVATDLDPKELLVRYRDDCFTVEVNPETTSRKTGRESRKRKHLPFQGKRHTRRSASVR